MVVVRPPAEIAERRHPEVPSPMGYDGRFGEFLATLVRRQGMSMADFAARVGLSASTLSRVRTGQRLPAPEQVAKWADALALDPENRALFIELALLART